MASTSRADMEDEHETLLRCGEAALAFQSEPAPPLMVLTDVDCGNEYS